jgi:hypothetical protein
MGLHLFHHSEFWKLEVASKFLEKFCTPDIKNLLLDRIFMPLETLHFFIFVRSEVYIIHNVTKALLILSLHNFKKIKV